MNDLGHLLRRHWLLLTLSAVAGGAAVFAYTQAVKPTYSATAAVQFQDITELEGFVGTPAGTLQTPAELASASARTVNTQPVLSAVRTALKTSRTTQQLGDALSTDVDPNSNLVLITGTGHTAEFAADLANQAASATAAITNQSTRAVFKQDAQQLQAQIAGIPRTAANAVTITSEQTDLSRLTTLSIVARPASITQPAQLPTSPSSPKPAFDTIVGAVLAFLACGGVLLMRRGLDRTLSSQAEIEDALELPILLQLEASQLGTAPFVDSTEGERSERITAAFGMLRRGIELMRPDGPCRVIAVTSGGPEEGKTTVSVSLAGAFARLGRSTVLVECDLRRPALGPRVNLPTEPGLTDHLADGVPLEEITHSLLLADQPSAGTNGSHPSRSMACILAGRQIRDPDELLASSRFKELIRDLSESYEVVVIDTAPILPVPDTLEILPLADTRVVCARAHQSRRTELEAVRVLLGRVPAAVTVGVTTGWTRKDLELSSHYYGYDSYPSEPRTPVAPKD